MNNIQYVVEKLVINNLFLIIYLCSQPANQGKCVRIYLTVILVCQTYVAPLAAGEKLTRDHLTCKITYCSVG